jgi:hypothetical protein
MISHADTFIWIRVLFDVNVTTDEKNGDGRCALPHVVAGYRITDNKICLCNKCVRI